MSDIKLLGYVPGAIGRVTELHAVYYAENWGFGQFFEAKVATELSEFLSRFDGNRDGFWTTCLNGQVQGAIAIDGIKAESEGAHLRWFIMSSILRGRGFGRKLMENAVRFCRQNRYPRVYLWTFQGLDAARHLYESFGFCLVQEQKGAQWGTKVIEQKFLLQLQ